jgi:U6 snRNA-associated Sm-like protein LSm7
MSTCIYTDTTLPALLHDNLVALTFNETRPRSDPETNRITDKTRRLGMVVIRGTQVSLVSPQDGVEEIANPFIVHEDET